MRIKTLILLAFLVLAPAFGALAGETDALRKRIMLDQKKLVVMENMEFTPEEAKAFWPVYEKHQEELFRINQKVAKLIVAYAAVFQTLTDDQADKIVAEYFSIHDERQAAMKKFMNDLKGVLPGKKAFRYLQVENKLETLARYELSKGIPLAQ